nr:extracellular solute-binding protein [Pseudobdellovibrionaceae bacterium]
MKRLINIFSFIIISWVLSISLPLFASATAIETNTSPKKVRLQIWHQMIYSHRAILADAVEEYEKRNPHIDIDLTYRETEELRSSFQAAAMGGSGPDLIYGPSDQVGPFATMGIIRPLENLFEGEFFKQFDPLSTIQYQGHIYMQGDMVGNHLMLIYNKKLLTTPPKNTDELIAMAKENTLDIDKDGVIDRYGLVWNMTEPFFFVPWIKGFGEHFLDANNMPHLATESTQRAFQLIQKFKNLRIVPQESDYELANALFKEGKAAMIINGDWSWGDYQKANLDFGVAPLPQVSETGLWPAPLVGTKGYSMNIHIREENLESVKDLLRYLTSSEVQLRFTEKANTLPSNLELRTRDIVKNNELLKASSEVMKHGEPMPIVPEIRATWDALRGKYQSVLAGKLEPNIAALDAQKDSLKQIDAMNKILEPDASAQVIYFISFLLVLIILVKVYRSLPQIKKEWNSSTRFAFIMMIPAFLGLLLVVLYPFAYNLILSVSNLSLKTFFNWKIIGLHHYFNVINDPQFYLVLLKT